MERRLAAILAADAAGYSRMMREDEPGALALLHKHRSEVIALQGNDHVLLEQDPATQRFFEEVSLFLAK